MIRVGLIGLGQMGLPIARNLLNKGFNVVAYDLRRAKVDEVAKLGAEEAAGPRDVATKSDVIITLLSYPHVVQEVITGAGGVLEGLRKDSIIMECSSIDDETSIRVAHAVAGVGGRFVEVAILGRPHVIDARQLVFLVAGEEGTVKDCESILNTLGRKVLYVGPYGAAKVLKIANAMANATEIAILCEVAAWSKKNGVSVENLLEVLEIRSEESSSRVKQLKRIIEGDLKREVTWMAKDVHHATKIANEQRIAIPVTSAVRTVIALAEEQNTDGYSFFEMIWRFYNRNHEL